MLAPNRQGDWRQTLLPLLSGNPYWHETGRANRIEWEDVDWKLSTIQVKRQVGHFKGGSYTFLEPKSKSGVRTIVLGRQALEVLQSHKMEQERIINSANGNWTSLDLVFPSGIGTPLTASNIRRASESFSKH
jgi:hypothetical protein